MKLVRLEIENFKGLRNATFSPGPFSCLVGENNAGKSSVLQALVYLLKRPTNLPASVYYDPTVPVVFRGTFSEIAEADINRLEEEHRARLAPLIVGGQLTVIAHYSPGERVAIKVSATAPADPRYADDAIDEVFKGKRGAQALRQALENSYPEFLEGIPELATIGAAKAYVEGRINALPADQFVPMDKALPSGMSASITQLLPEPIYIPAVKNLDDDLKTSQSTSFGRLLGLLLEDMNPDLALVQSALDQLNMLMNRVEVNGVLTDSRHAKMKSLERLVEGFLVENFPRVKVELYIPPPDLKVILNGAQIYVDDGSRDLIDEKGDGIKRCLTFALLRAYVQKLTELRNQNGNQRPLIFLFEEPELYLHPQSQRILFATLATISSNHPVVVTTHSPLFFAPGITAVFIRVAKQDHAPKPMGALYPVDFRLDPEKAEVFQLTRFENAEAGFFSRRVVLFEGESDDIFIKHVAAKLRTEWRFDQAGISLVRVGGKGNFAKFRRFFEAFGIQVKIIADLDTLTDGFQHLGVSQACNGLRSAALQAVDARVMQAQIFPAITAQRVKSKITQSTWKTRYDAAKAALLNFRNGVPPAQADINAIEGLFVWESDEARLLAIQHDEASRNAVVPLFDAMRAEGVCVLSKGAIEDYYPPDFEGGGNKPQRAIGACSVVPSEAIARSLSAPLAANREPELVEILTAMFAA